MTDEIAKRKAKTKENLQMVIYLVPHAEDDSLSLYEKKYDSEWARENMEKVIKLLGRCEHEQQI